MHRYAGRYWRAQIDFIHQDGKQSEAKGEGPRVSVNVHLAAQAV
jgi:hypothetical protein